MGLVSIGILFLPRSHFTLYHQGSGRASSPQSPSSRGRLVFQAWVKTAESSPLLTLIMGVKMSAWNFWWPTYATEDETNKEERKHRLCCVDLFLATLYKPLDQAMPEANIWTNLIIWTYGFFFSSKTKPSRVCITESFLVQAMVPFLPLRIASLRCSFFTCSGIHQL